MADVIRRKNAAGDWKVRVAPHVVVQGTEPTGDPDEKPLLWVNPTPGAPTEVWVDMYTFDPVAMAAGFVAAPPASYPPRGTRPAGSAQDAVGMTATVVTDAGKSVLRIDIPGNWAQGNYSAHFGGLPDSFPVGDALEARLVVTKKVVVSGSATFSFQHWPDDPAQSFAWALARIGTGPLMGPVDPDYVDVTEATRIGDWKVGFGNPAPWLTASLSSGPGTPGAVLISNIAIQKKVRITPSPLHYYDAATDKYVPLVTP
jgi:hypothetical protein